MSGEERRWPERRFSQAISEGDGISVIPLLRGDLPTLARAAEDAGAEALAVESVKEVDHLRSLTDLPLLVREVVADLAALRAVRASGADACVLLYDDLADDDELLEELVERGVGARARLRLRRP